MDKATKIIIGAVGTSLLAWGAHSAIGTGEQFVDRLETRGNTALQDGGFAGVDLAVKNDPVLTRTIVLSGDESKKEEAIAAVKQVPGVGRVIWAGDEEGGDGDAAPASAEAVAECQSNVDELMAGKTINFKSGSAYMAADSNAIVNDVVAALKPCSGMSITVEGHTDLTGSAQINKTLSQARADAVMAELVKGGIDADRVAAQGFGSEQPLENAMTAAANAKNRRTVFKLSSAGEVAADDAAKEGEE